MLKNLIIISESASFPWGMAATTRIRNLAKALKDQGWNVSYLGLRGACIRKQQGRTYRPCDRSAEIPFFYPGCFSVRPDNWWLRRIDDISGFVLTILMLIVMKSIKAVDAAILYSSSTPITGFWISFLHLLRIPVILDVCEWPLAIALTKDRGFNEAKRFCRTVVPLADGAIVISSFIEREIKLIALKRKKNIPLFVAPILIGKEAETLPESKSNFPFILYCGSIAYMDIAEMVIDILCELKKQLKPIPVFFSGDDRRQEFHTLKSYARRKGVAHLITFTGFVPDTELQRLMSLSVCLLAPLPENLQSVSRFPTKIGYYLASGTPVVTNGVGDVKLYLEDGVNAYVADRYEAKLFVEKINMILEDPDSSKNIGRAGRELSLNRFHYSNACAGLSDYVHKIVEDFTNR